MIIFIIHESVDYLIKQLIIVFSLKGIVQHFWELPFVAESCIRRSVPLSLEDFVTCCFQSKC